jgi:hypothetical protein
MFWNFIWFLLCVIWAIMLAETSPWWALGSAFVSGLYFNDLFKGLLEKLFPML